MKRDMDFIRDILLEIEKHPKMDGAHIEALGLDLFPGRSAGELSFHIGLLKQAGFIRVGAETLNGDRYLHGLTWEGCEFLDAVRDPDVWKKAKDGAAKAGGAGLAFVLEIAKAIARAELQKRGILPG